jgi:hypothetical protein
MNKFNEAENEEDRNDDAFDEGVQNEPSTNADFFRIVSILFVLGIYFVIFLKIMFLS